MWYGDYDYQLIDTDYTSYALFYSCTEKYFGLRTKRTINVLVRNPNTQFGDLKASVQYRISSLIYATQYRGMPLIDINQKLPECIF
jgi:hypothetical protein